MAFTGNIETEFLLTHYRRHDTTGRLIKISIHWTQLEGGVSTPFYKYNYKQLAPLLTPTWMTHLWDYLSTCNSKIEENKPWTYQKTCHNDFFLMDMTMEADISVEKKIIFNEIRLHLQLLTAADIVLLGSGSTIIPHVFNCVNTRKSTLEWPDTKPFPRKWMKVRRTLLSTYIQPRLRYNPLSISRSQGHQQWTTYSTPDASHILWGGNVYKKHGNTRSSKYMPTCEVIECSKLADVLIQYDNLILLGTHSFKQHNQPLDTSNTAWDY